MNQEVLAGSWRTDVDAGDLIKAAPVSEDDLSCYDSSNITLIASNDLQIDQGSLKIAFSGYLFSEEKPQELIAEAYRENGPSFPRYLQGNFLIALYDEVKDRIFLVANDKGLQSFFFSKVEDGLVFSSHLTSLLYHPQVETTLDRKALEQHLSFYWASYFGGKTLVEGVSKIPLIHVLYSKKDGLGLYRYQDFYHKEKLDLSDREASKLIEELLLDSVEKNLQQSPKPPLVVLSGGLDSTLLTSLLKEKTDEVHTMTWGWSRERLEEVRERASVLGTVHHSFKRDFRLPSKKDIWRQQQPEPAPTFYFNGASRIEDLDRDSYFTGAGAVITSPVGTKSLLKLEKFHFFAPLLRLLRPLPYEKVVSFERQKILNTLSSPWRSAPEANRLVLPQKTARSLIRNKYDYDTLPKVDSLWRLEQRPIAENSSFICYSSFLMTNVSKWPAKKYDPYLYSPLREFVARLPVYQTADRRLMEPIIAKRVPKDEIEWENSGVSNVSRVIARCLAENQSEYQAKVKRFIERGFLKKKASKILLTDDIRDQHPSQIIYCGSVYALEVWLETIIEGQKPWKPPK